MVFPFLYAVSPDSWAWQDGRYANYLPPLMAIMIVCGMHEGARRFGLSRTPLILMMSAITACAAVVSVVGMQSVINYEAASYTAHWDNPDAATLGAIQRLRASGVVTGYANYWVAYKLDFLSKGTLAIATAGYEVDRSPSIDADVTKSPHPAWLFVPKGEAFRDGIQFTAPPLIVGPDMLTEQQFIKELHQKGIRYRIIDTGLLRAVIPARTLTPYQVGLPGSTQSPP